MRTLVLTFLLAGLCSAGIIRVPSQQPTIQAGLNAAGDGDTVLVAADTYRERVTWPAIDGITLLGEQGAAATVIDAERNGRALAMNAVAYTSATVVEGFTIANGLVSGGAAGIDCRGAPVFRRNRISDNLGLQYTMGGGVHAEGAPTFFGNLFARDSLQVRDTPGFRYGGAVYCAGPGVFIDNVFSENAVFDSSCSGYRQGGAIHLASGAALVFGNLFVRNAARMLDGSGFAYGGAVSVGDDAAAVIANNTFVANVCAAHIGYGSAVWAPLGPSVVKNNIAVHDSVLGSGGGALASDSAAMVFDWNDAWHNHPNDYHNCTPGPNAISLDPLFAAAPFGDYCLSQVAAGQAEDSPCLDAGDSLRMAAPLDLDSLLREWTTRTDSVPDAGQADLGFHYAPWPLTGVLAPPAPRPARPLLVVSPSVVSEKQVRLNGPANAEMAVCDVTGRVVLRPGRLGADGHARITVAGLANGVYTVRAGTGDSAARARLLVRR
ncbi:hypothetical protein JXB37_01470 [candidate division WOR-3 bacterium]|nr:hypothetical protein [candidate division WOR-3 bacterium]